MFCKLYAKKIGVSSAGITYTIAENVDYYDDHGDHKYDCAYLVA